MTETPPPSPAATRPPRRRAALLASAGLLLAGFIACVETPTAPQQPVSALPADTPLLARIDCVADVRASSLACRSDDPAAASATAAQRDIILGGQGQFVFLAAANAHHTGDVYSFDVTLQNLIGQSLGTVDGVTPDPSGVRVFFASTPIAIAGAGTIDFIDPVTSLLMADGTSRFTASNQPYFQYDGILATNQTTPARTWRMHVPASVSSFTFTLYVSAAVQFPTGFITLSQSAVHLEPGAPATLAATVRDPLGRTVGGAAVVWTSNATGIATVDASGVVTAVAEGTALVTATSGTRSASATIIVQRLPTAVVGNSAPVVVVPVGGTLSANEYPSVRFNDAGGAVVPNAFGASATFTVTGGACTLTGGAVTVPVDASGAATLTGSDLGLPATAGSCTVHAVSTPSLPGSPVDFDIVVAPVAAVGYAWTGVVSDDFSLGANWSGGVSPDAGRATYIAKRVPHAPVLTANAAVGSVQVETGASLGLGGDTLTVGGSIDAGTAGSGGGISNGFLLATGTGTIAGTLPALALGSAGACGGSSYALGGATSADSVALNCPLALGGNALTIAGALRVQGSDGLLVMHDPAGHVAVSGSAVFAGASTAGAMDAGTLDVGGDFTQAGTNSATSFSPAGGQLTRLTGTAGQTVSFSDPASSGFRDLQLTNASASGVTITSVVTVSRDFSMGASSRISGTFAGGGKRLVVAGAVTTSSTSTLGGLDSLQVTGSVFPNYQNPNARTAPLVTVLTGSSTLSGNVTVAGGLAIGSGAQLTIGVRTLTIRDSLVVDGNVAMASTSGQVIVAGLARFRGGSATSGMQSGTLRVGGDFIEQGTAASFSTGSGFITQLNGTGAQTVSFDHSGASMARFDRLDVLNTTSGGVTFATDVRVSGDLQQKGRLTIGSGTTTTVDGVADFLANASTTIVGTLFLNVADFYNASFTIGPGTLITNTCYYGSTINGTQLFVGGGAFNVTTCSPGRYGPLP